MPPISYQLSSFTVYCSGTATNQCKLIFSQHDGILHGNLAELPVHDA